MPSYKSSPKDPKNAVGSEIQRLREQNGLSQLDLAALLAELDVNMTVSTISKIENQRRGITDIELLAFARIFHAKIEELFS